MVRVRVGSSITSGPILTCVDFEREALAGHRAEVVLRAAKVLARVGLGQRQEHELGALLSQVGRLHLDQVVGLEPLDVGRRLRLDGTLDCVRTADGQLGRQRLVDELGREVWRASRLVG